jgi:leader peptidase (prepilin peptidase)/N-methyltransferase
VFVSLLIIITFIDLDTYLIPDVLSVSGILIGWIASFATPRLAWWDSLVGILLGGGFFYAIAVAYRALRKQDGLGGGDIKLLAMIGAFTGWPGALFTVLASSLVGTTMGAVIMLRSKRGLATMIPFGPFLALGAVSYLLWGEAFYVWYLDHFIVR